MKYFFIVLTFISLQAFAYNDCRELAVLELETAKHISEYRMDNYNSITKSENELLKIISSQLLNSADRNYTNSVFNMNCTSEIVAITEAQKYMTSLDQNETILNIIRLLDNLKMKLGL